LCQFESAHTPVFNAALYLCPRFALNPSAASALLPAPPTIPAASSASVLHWLASCAIAAAATAAAASASQQAGFVVEDLLASKVFTALVNTVQSSASLSGVSGEGSGSSSVLLNILLEVINPRNLPLISRALSRVLLYPRIHADFARIAGEITALHVACLLHQLHTSDRNEEFKTALEDCLKSIKQHVTDKDVANSCVNQLLITMCAHANVAISDRCISAAALAISGESRVEQR
jgi:hypothetical protein